MRLGDCRRPRACDGRARPVGWSRLPVPARAGLLTSASPSPCAVSTGPTQATCPSGSACVTCSGRYSFTATRWRQFVVVFGGFGGEGRSLNDLLFYNVHRDEWTTQARSEDEPWPDRRCRHAAVILEQSLFVVGGGNKRTLADVWCAKLEMTGGVAPAARWHDRQNSAKPALCVGDALLVVGGFGQPLSRIQRVPMEQSQLVTVHVTLGLGTSAARRLPALRRL